MAFLVTRTSIVGADTTPDAFTFTDQTGVALSTTTTSAAITVAGINAAATISVSGGTYDINASGSFTSSSGTVNNGDTVRARHTSSGSNSTAVNTVVTIGGVSDTFTSTTTSGVSLVAPASGVTYENRLYADMNYANDAAALAGGVISTLDDGGTGRTRWSWDNDPGGGGLKVWKNQYIQDEDNCQARIDITPSKYVYLQWEEYWHASYTSSDNGKANRTMSPSGTLFLDHIYYGAPGNSNYGFVLQGADVGWNVERNTRSPALTKGEWNTIAVEQKASTGSDGYLKIWQKIGAGSWNQMPLDFRQYPHGGSDTFLSNQAFFAGQTCTNAAHLYGRLVVGGWLSLSGGTPGANDVRWIRNVLCLYNVTNAPT